MVSNPTDTHPVSDVAGIVGSDILTNAAFEAVLVKLAKAGASDVFIDTDEPMTMRIHGRNQSVSTRVIASFEIDMLIERAYGAAGSARVKSSAPLDYVHNFAIAGERGVESRWRVNATGTRKRTGAVSLTYRHISHVPPLVATLGLPDEIVSWNPSKGIFMAVGVTGSGKSTLLAAVHRHRLETMRNLVVRTLEDPVEYSLTSFPRDQSNVVAQSAVGPSEDISSFAAGVRNVLRRAPTDIFVGEGRDRETIEAMIVAAQTGHRVWTTSHASDVAGTLNRLVNAFDTDRRLRTVELIENLSLVVVQALVPNLSGTRTALREWMSFDAETRDRLLAAPIDSIQLEVKKIQRERGLPTLEDSARIEVGNGNVSEAQVAGYLI